MCTSQCDADNSAFECLGLASPFGNSFFEIKEAIQRPVIVINDKSVFELYEIR